MDPFKNIQSKHLSIVLSFARILCFLSMIAFIAILFGTVFGSLFGYPVLYFIAFLWFPIFGFILSALLAALVAFEEGFRQRTERLLSNEHEAGIHPRK